MYKKAKLLTNREMELFRLALREAEANAAEANYQGSLLDLATELAAKLSFKINDDDIDDACKNLF